MPRVARNVFALQPEERADVERTGRRCALTTLRCRIGADAKREVGHGVSVIPARDASSAACRPRGADPGDPRRGKTSFVPCPCIANRPAQRVDTARPDAAAAAARQFAPLTRNTRAMSSAERRGSARENARSASIERVAGDQAVGARATPRPASPTPALHRRPRVQCPSSEPGDAKNRRAQRRRCVVTGLDGPSRPRALCQATREHRVDWRSNWPAEALAERLERPTVPTADAGRHYTSEDEGFQRRTRLSCGHAV